MEKLEPKLEPSTSHALVVPSKVRELLYDPAIPFPGLCPKELRAEIQTETQTDTYTLSSISHNRQKGETTLQLMNEEVKCGTAFPSLSGRIRSPVDTRNCA